MKARAGGSSYVLAVADDDEGSKAQSVASPANGGIDRMRMSDNDSIHEVCSKDDILAVANVGEYVNVLKS